MVKFILRVDILSVPYETALRWRIPIDEKSDMRQ